MSDISHPITKASIAVGAWSALFTDWITTAGKVCAAATAIAIFGELVWKRVVKPLYRKFKE